MLPNVRAMQGTMNDESKHQGYDRETIDSMLQRLIAGESMRRICSDPEMPSRMTVARWCDGDDEVAAKILRAREIGFLDAGDAAVEAAKNCEDPIRGRLAFDAEKWRLERLSQAFSAKPQKIELDAKLKHDGPDIFASFAEALERAATAISSGAGSTVDMVVEGEVGANHTARRLADLADHGGEGMGQD